MPRPAQYEFVRLAGGFPPGLNSLDETTDLEDGFIPSGTGFDLDADGLITKNVTAPTGTAAVQKTVTLDETGIRTGGVSSVPFLWHHGRLWNITGRTAATASNLLYVGATNYTDRFYHAREPIAFDEDAQTILKILPFEPDSLFIAKTTGSYVLRNLSDTRTFFQKTDMIQEMRCPAANRIAELDSVIYVTNASGLMAYQNGQTKEVSRQIRGTALSGLAVTVDYGKKFVILGTTYVYDVQRDRWFNYDGSTFSFKTRTHRNPDWSPFSVDRLVFGVKNTGSDDARFSYKYKIEDDSWSDAYTVDVLFDEGEYTTKATTLDDRRVARRFQLEITSMDSGISLRDIFLDVQNHQYDGYSA